MRRCTLQAPRPQGRPDLHSLLLTISQGGYALRDPAPQLHTTVATRGIKELLKYMDSDAQQM